MKYLIAILIAITMLGCATLTPADHDRILNQMEAIARNAVIVYDPTLTDADFEKWVAEHEYQYRQFVALMRLYSAVTDIADQDMSRIYDMNQTMIQSKRDLDDVDHTYYDASAIDDE